MKKYFYIFVLISGFFLIPHFTHAASYPMQYFSNGGDPYYQTSTLSSPMPAASSTFYVECFNSAMYTAVLSQPTYYYWAGPGPSGNSRSSDNVSLYSGTSSDFWVAMHMINTTGITSVAAIQFKSSSNYGPCNGTNNIVLYDSFPGPTPPSLSFSFR